MPLFSSITACTDFSPGAAAAVERAAAIALSHGASLRLLYAYDAGRPNGAGELPPASTTTPAGGHPALAVRMAEMRQRLDELAHQLTARTGLKVDTVFGVGPAHLVIGEHMQAQAPALLVLSSRFDPATAGLGGTALKLLRVATCPVLVVRTNSTRSYRHVLSAVDLRDGSVRAAVTALALFPEAHHHLLYAVAPALDSSLAAGGLDVEQVQSLHEAMHQNAERELQLLARGFSTTALHPVSAEVASDAPARALLVGAATLQADCVVVGHHDEATVGQSELGSMALHVLQFVPGDVLVVP